MVTLKTQSELHTSHSSSEYVVLTAIFVLAVYGLFSGSLTNEFTGAQVATADLDVAGPINTSTIVSTAQRVGVDKGTIAFRFTPTWNMVDGLRHGFFQSGSDTWANDANRITIVKWDSNNNLYFRRMGDGVNQFNDLILAPTDSVLGTGKTVQEFFKPGQAVDVAWTWYKDPDDGNKPKMNVSLNNYFVKNQTYTVTQPRFVEIIHTFGIGHNGPQWPGTLSGTLTNIKLSTETKIPASNLGIPGGTPSNPQQAKSGPMTVTISNPTPSTILSRGTSIVTATVSGLSASQNTTIFWAVGGGETFGTITPTTSSGSPATFTAPTVTTRTIVTLLATPTSDTSKSAITTVTIDPTPQVIQPTLGIPRNGNSTSS